MPVPEAASNRLIGELFVERGFISQSQLLVALELQRESGQQLGQILVERFGVKRAELAQVVAEHWARMGEDESDGENPRASESWQQLGEILVSRGFVTREQLVQALDRQRQTGERLGEALVGQGVLSKFELAGSLAEQASLVTAPSDDAASGQPEATVVPLTPRAESPPVAESGPEPGGERPELDVAHSAIAYLAFVSTPQGYRLLEVEHDELPDVGERVEIPELGDQTVLRIGASPLPLDGRRCVYLEPLDAVHALAVG